MGKRASREIKGGVQGDREEEGRGDEEQGGPFWPLSFALSLP